MADVRPESVPLGCTLARCWLNLAQCLLRLSGIGVTEYAREFLGTRVHEKLELDVVGITKDHGWSEPCARCAIAAGVVLAGVVLISFP
ncbi:MAG TPA: hypothetical protein VGP27_14615 [Mycobacterium sp.]|jgi:hypothetical protein|nr:hypothetical protein [Mycobacterium sp.]